MSDPPKEQPAGMWVLVTKLKSDFKRGVCVQPTFIVPIVRTWASSRKLHGMPTFETVRIRVSDLQKDQVGIVHLFGGSSYSVSETKKILEELAKLLTELLEQKSINVFVAGEHFVASRPEVERPADVLLN